MLVTAPRNVTLLRMKQSSNVPVPMLLTLAEIVTSARAEQKLNA